MLLSVCTPFQSSKKIMNAREAGPRANTVPSAKGFYLSRSNLAWICSNAVIAVGMVPAAKAGK
jgi:hypothetical protein